MAQNIQNYEVFPGVCCVDRIEGWAKKWVWKWWKQLCYLWRRQGGLRGESRTVDGSRWVAFVVVLIFLFDGSFFLFDFSFHLMFDSPNFLLVVVQVARGEVWIGRLTFSFWIFHEWKSDLSFSSLSLSLFPQVTVGPEYTLNTAGTFWDIWSSWSDSGEQRGRNMKVLKNSLCLILLIICKWVVFVMLSWM